MDQKEALEKINEIHGVIESSNRGIFSGEKMIVIGALVTLVPVIEMALSQLNSLFHGGDAAPILMILHTVFWMALFYGVGKVMPWKVKGSQTMHPLIEKAFSLKTPFMLCIFGIMVTFASIGRYEFIHPLVLVVLGLMFSLYGRFTIPAVTYIAYSYIVLGFIYLYVSQMQVIPNLWIYIVVYNGLTYVLMGLFLKREQVRA